MTKKFAVFVEGLTEQEFTIRLLTELAGSHGIEFEVHTQHKGYLSWSELRTHRSPVIHVLVANCCNDEQVKSQIKDRYDLLKSAGYSLIVGLRDVYPLMHNDIAELEKNLLIGLPDDSLPICLHLAIMEIEAWFLEEITHFSRIDNKITTAELIANGFDYNKICACDLPHPTETLGKIYQSVGKGYNKNKRHVQRTIEALSYEELYVNTRQKAPSLEKFITSLEAGLFSIVSK
jgi:hypothetical protein